MRSKIQVPVLLMGYINPVLQFGVERFCQKCNEVGVDGLILPDLPMAEYEREYKAIFERYGLFNIFLITPQTSDERIRQIEVKAIRKLRNPELKLAEVFSPQDCYETTRKKAESLKKLARRRRHD
jgi:hypothetical protein